MKQYDTAEKYYMQEDYNCAESVLHAANDEMNLGLDEKTFLAIGGFGGGMQCGGVCGAVSGGVAAISAKYIKTYAHDCPELQEHVDGFVKRVREEMGSDQCCVLKEQLFNDQTRCYPVVEKIFNILMDCEK